MKSPNSHVSLSFGTNGFDGEKCRTNRIKCPIEQACRQAMLLR